MSASVEPAALRLAREEGYQAGLAEGRRLAAVEASIRLRQLGLDLVAEARSGAPGAVLLGNSSGVGSVPGREA